MRRRSGGTRAALLVAAALAALAAALAAPGPARGAPSEGEGRKVLLGLFGGVTRFDGLTGQGTSVGHTIVGWGQIGSRQPERWRSLMSGNGPVPMIGLGASGAMSPRAIAQGQGDDFLVGLNSAVAEWEGRIYIRPLAEMNGHWNDYSAFNKNGSPRGPAHTTAQFKKAFARIYLVVHGGPQVDAKLRALGLPPVGAQLAANPMPRVRVVWNPQGHGSPVIPANSAQAYFPGDAYVDVVANDLYNIRGKAEWASNEALYKAHPNKPYAIAEWANWGIDDPGFVEAMAQFVRTHGRVELVSYYNGRPGSPWDLGGQPRSLRAYRAAIVPLGR